MTLSLVDHHGNPDDLPPVPRPDVGSKWRQHGGGVREVVGVATVCRSGAQLVVHRGEDGRLMACPLLEFWTPVRTRDGSVAAAFAPVE